MTWEEDVVGVSWRWKALPSPWYLARTLSTKTLSDFVHYTWKNSISISFQHILAYIQRLASHHYIDLFYTHYKHVSVNFLFYISLFFLTLIGRHIYVSRASQACFCLPSMNSQKKSTDVGKSCLLPLGRASTAWDPVPWPHLRVETHSGLWQLFKTNKDSPMASLLPAPNSWTYFPFPAFVGMSLAVQHCWSTKQLKTIFSPLSVPMKRPLCFTIQLLCIGIACVLRIFLLLLWM